MREVSDINVTERNWNCKTLMDASRYDFIRNATAELTF